MTSRYNLRKNRTQPKRYNGEDFNNTKDTLKTTEHDEIRINNDDDVASTDSDLSSHSSMPSLESISDSEYYYSYLDNETHISNTAKKQYTLVFQLTGGGHPTQMTNYILEASSLPKNNFEQHTFFPNSCIPYAYNIIPYLNTAAKDYKNKFVGTDLYNQFLKHLKYTISNITLRERNINKDSTIKDIELFQDLETNWLPYNTSLGELIFDGATFHYIPDWHPEYNNDNSLPQPQLIISEKDNQKSTKQVTFNGDISKWMKNLSVKYSSPLTNNLSVACNTNVNNNLSVASNTSLDNDLSVACNTSLANNLSVACNTSLDNEFDVVENSAKIAADTLLQLSKPSEPPEPPKPFEPNTIYKQTYQIFNINTNKAASTEYMLYTNSLVSPLLTIRDLWLKDTYFIKNNQYILFKYVTLNIGIEEDLACVTWNTSKKEYDIILYNNHIDYNINKFRKDIWWEYSNSATYKISIVTYMDAEINSSLNRVRNNIAHG